MPRTGPAVAVLLFALPAVAQVTPPTQPMNLQPLPADNRVPVPGSGVPIAATPPPAAAPVDPTLKAHLDGWERVMKAVVSYSTKCTLERNNTLLQKKIVYDGSIICLKPNLARMRLDRRPAAGQKADPNDYTAYICSGKAVYEYDGTAKQLTEYKLPNGGVGDNLLLEFMSGSMTADQALRRFDIKLAKADANYVYITISPLAAKDKADFSTLTLVLFQPGLKDYPQLAYLPRTVVMAKPNGQETETWDFPPPPAINDPAVKKEWFDPVPPPKDWKVQQAQAPQPAPMPVARPVGP